MIINNPVHMMPFGFENNIKERVPVEKGEHAVLYPHQNFLILTVPFPTVVGFVASVDQDQVAQNVQPSLDLYCPLW